MPNITTIAQVGEMEGGDQIKQIKVTVKQVYPAKTGSNEWGDWRIQSAMVSDETGTIRASFYDFQDIKRFQGGVVTITAGKDGKGHQSGIEAYDYEDKKKNTVTRQLKINSNAIIDEDVRPSAPQGAGVADTKSNGHALSYGDEKRESIERQVALRESVNFMGALPDKDRTVDTLINTANRIYDEFFAAKPEVKAEPEAPQGEEKVI